MSTRPMRNSRLPGAIVLLVLSPVFHAPPANASDAESKLFAPMNEIGLRLEDWVAYLGPDYTIIDASQYPNAHTRQPMAFLRLSDGSTKVGFQVNLITNEHFLMEVTTHSPEFIDRLGIDELPANPGDTITIVDDWDAGLNRLDLVRWPGGRVVAQWIYYVD